MPLINYPNETPQRMSWGLQRAGTVVEGPTGLVQRQDFTGARWRLNALVPPLKGDDAAIMRTFLQRATSASIWFQAPDYGYRRRSVASGTPRVNGAGQTGASLNLKGFGASVTGALKLGDRIGLTSGQVVTVTADANSNGSGNLTATIDPPLRASPTDDSLIYVDTPLVVFRLADHNVTWDVELALVHGFAIDAVEDITSGVPAVSYGTWP